MFDDDAVFTKTEYRKSTVTVSTTDRRAFCTNIDIDRRNGSGRNRAAFLISQKSLDLRVDGFIIKGLTLSLSCVRVRRTVGRRGAGRASARVRSIPA